MPPIGETQDVDSIIDVVNIENNDLGLNENGSGNESVIDNGSNNGTWTDRIKAINDIPDNKIPLDQLLMNLVSSGNEKYAKLASDLMEINMTHGQVSDNLGSDCFDKISVTANVKQNTEQGINNDETNMEWTTVRPKNKRTRTNSDDSKKINTEITLSPNKKQKSADNRSKTKIANGNKDNSIQGHQGQIQANKNTEIKSGAKARNPLNKDSVLIIVTEIPESTYLNSIKMENMILNAFPRLRETGMWTRYRINKKHERKCYITLPKEHFNENISEVIKSQIGFESSKVKVVQGINDVPEKAHKVVAIGVHQTISEDEIKSELAKHNITINKVQRLKFNGQPTRKVVIEFENEQDKKIALFSGIYFGRMRIRCETYRITPPVTQCYKCQGFNHVAKDCKSNQKCVRCAGPHKSADCPDRNKGSLILKCSNCDGNHVASSKNCPKFKEQIKIQADRVKTRQEKAQNSLVVRGITFSNMVQNKTDKVQSDLTEKIQTNKRETEQVLDKVVQKLESRLETAFKELSEKVVSFMVNSMLEIYEKLDKKNADKVYDILCKESVEHFNLRLDPVSPPLAPPTSVDTSAARSGSSQQNKTKKNATNKKAPTPRQVPKTSKPQNYVAPPYQVPSPRS